MKYEDRYDERIECITASELEFIEKAFRERWSEVLRTNMQWATGKTKLEMEGELEEFVKIGKKLVKINEIMKSGDNICIKRF